MRRMESHISHCSRDLLRNGAIKPLRLTTEILHQNFSTKGEFSSFTSLIYLAFWSVCRSNTFRPRPGRIKSNLVLNRRFRNNSVGVWPVVLFGVVRYLIGNRAEFCIIESLPSRLGHQTWRRASDFVRTIPGCPVCNSYSTRSRSWLGISTRIPHNKQPSLTVISWR